MKIKIISMVLSFAVVLVAGFTNVDNANAQSVTFPYGCSSALGYSLTTGLPCSGTSRAIEAPMDGCMTAIGRSTSTGLPCSGSSVVLNYLAGCSSMYGYSTFTSRPCNGTSTVYLLLPGTIPGLPRTGAGDNALNNILILLASGLTIIIGVAYMSRQSKTS